MPLQRVPINNFRGGLNTRDSPFELMPNESPDLQNVTLSSLVGQLRMRDGKTRFDTNSPAATIDHCRQVVLNGTHWLMCSINGSIYSCDQAGNFVLRYTGTAATQWDFAQMPDATDADHVWCMNANDPPQKWDGVAASTSAWSLPPTTTFGRIIVWRAKMVVVAGGVSGVHYDRVYLSKTGDPEATTGSYDFVDLKGDDDELGSNVEVNVLGDRLYIFKQRSVWVMTDPVTFQNRRLGEPGCAGRFQSDVCEEKLYWFNEQGIWSTGGVAVAYESGSINNYFPNHLNLSAIFKARLVATRDSYPRILLSIAIDGSNTNNVMIELVPHINFRRIGGRRYLLLPAFMIHTFSASSLAAYRAGQFAPWGVYGGDSSVNKLYKYFSGPTDDGAAIPAWWQSAWMAIQGEEPFERVRRLNVELQGDASVSVYGDFKPTPDFTATMPAGTGSNLVVDGDFEGDTLGTLPASWRYVGLGSCVVGNAWAASGSKSLRSTVVNPPQNQYGPVTTVNVVAGTAYNMSAWMRVFSVTNTGGTDGIIAAITFYDAGNTFISGQDAIVVPAGGGLPGVYQVYLNGVVAPANAVTAQIFLSISQNSDTGTLDFAVDLVSFSSAPVYRFARVRPESRARFHSIKFNSVPGGQPFQINVAELAIRGGKEH